MDSSLREFLPLLAFTEQINMKNSPKEEWELLSFKKIQHFRIFRFLLSRQAVFSKKKCVR